MERFVRYEYCDESALIFENEAKKRVEALGLKVIAANTSTANGCSSYIKTEVCFLCESHLYEMGFSPNFVKKPIAVKVRISNHESNVSRFGFGYETICIYKIQSLVAQGLAWAPGNETEAEAIRAKITQIKQNNKVVIPEGAIFLLGFNFTQTAFLENFFEQKIKIQPAFTMSGKEVGIFVFSTCERKISFLGFKNFMDNHFKKFGTKLLDFSDDDFLSKSKTKKDIKNMIFE